MAKDILFQKDLDVYLESVKKIASKVYDVYNEHKDDDDYLDKIVDKINESMDIPYLPDSLEGIAIEYVVTILIDIFEGNSNIDVTKLLEDL